MGFWPWLIFFGKNDNLFFVYIIVDCFLSAPSPFSLGLPGVTGVYGSTILACLCILSDGALLHISDPAKSLQASY
jgi:hypothetical protein